MKSLHLMAPLLLAVAAGLHGALPPRRKGGNRDYEPGPEPDPQRTEAEAALRNEIAVHNAAVDRRNAEKKAAKRARRITTKLSGPAATAEYSSVVPGPSGTEAKGMS